MMTVDILSHLGADSHYIVYMMLGDNCNMGTELRIYDGGWYY